MKAQQMHDTEIRLIGTDGHLRCKIDDDGSRRYFAADRAESTEFEIDEDQADMILAAQEASPGEEYSEEQARRTRAFQQGLESIMGRPVSVFTCVEFVYATFESFPVKGYVFAPDGFHDGARWLRNERELGNFMSHEVLECVFSGLGEIRITDTGDELLYHVDRGHVTYNGLKGL